MAIALISPVVRPPVAALHDFDDYWISAFHWMSLNIVDAAAIAFGIWVATLMTPWGYFRGSWLHLLLGALWAGVVVFALIPYLVTAFVRLLNAKSASLPEFRNSDSWTVAKHDSSSTAMKMQGNSTEPAAPIQGAENKVVSPLKRPACCKAERHGSHKAPPPHRPHKIVRLFAQVDAHVRFPLPRGVPPAAAVVQAVTVRGRTGVRLRGESRGCGPRVSVAWIPQSPGGMV